VVGGECRGVGRSPGSDYGVGEWWHVVSPSMPRGNGRHSNEGWYRGIRFWGGIVKGIAPLYKVKVFLSILPDLTH
jgi:hypothetical protein